MGITSTPWSNLPSILSIKRSKLSLYGAVYPCSSLPSSSSSSLLLSFKRCKLVSRRSFGTFVQKRSSMIVHCSQLKVEEDKDADACELVNGSELRIGEGNDTIHAYLFKAVKNNNGAGILLLSDIFGFEDSYTRDFAYRVACGGYNVLVPDLFRGDKWSKNRPQAQFKQWLSNQDLNRVAKDITTSTKWMVDEFMPDESSRKLGIIGFCYGGGRVLEVLANDQDSVFGTGVSFYGTRMDLSAAPNVKVPVLFVTGDNDALCPVATLNELENMIGKNSKVVVFKGRGHGFVHRPQSLEEDADAEEAFKIMRNWLHDQLLG